MKNILIVLMFVLIAGCTAPGGLQSTNNADFTNEKAETTEKTKTTEKVEVEDPLRCPQGGKFTCGQVTQGMAPDPENPAPKVCGCAPTKCSEGESLVISASAERWEDGTLKGIFICSSDLPS